MKRHPSLQPLSREHHTALLLAQLLKADAPGYRGLPTTVEGKVDYALRAFDRDLAPHFQKEEEDLIPKVEGRHAGLDELCETIRQEHRAIRHAFAELRGAAPGEAAALLDALGRLLEAHVRREERVWFPLIQQVLPEEELQELELE